MFGLTFEKLLVVLVLAAVIVGPHRLPLYAQQLGAFLRGVRAFVDATRARVETEVGTTLAVEEWRSLDPRQYDPRRIVREALAGPATEAAEPSAAHARTADAALVPEPGSVPDVGGVAGPDDTDRPAAGPVTGPPAEAAPQSAPAPARSGGSGIADLIARGAAARVAALPGSGTPLDPDGCQAERPAESVRQADAALSA